MTSSFDLVVLHRVRQVESDFIDVHKTLTAVRRAVDQHTVTLAHQSVLLNEHIARLDRIETMLERYEGDLRRLGEHTNLLKEILERLPAESSS